MNLLIEYANLDIILIIIPFECLHLNYNIVFNKVAFMLIYSFFNISTESLDQNVRLGSYKSLDKFKTI